jgi:phosphate starvation-inducible protein PhoH
VSRLTQHDIVRHDLVQRIVLAYDAVEQREQAAASSEDQDAQ